MEPNENNVTSEVNNEQQPNNNTPQQNNNQPVEQQEPEKQAPVDKQDNQSEQQEQEEEKKPKKTKDLKKFPVDSSNLDWVAYDRDKEDLYIQFRSGGLYVYHDVPYNIFEGLLYAGSKGRYHNLRIKWKYKYEKLRG